MLFAEYETKMRAEMDRLGVPQLVEMGNRLTGNERAGEMAEGMLVHHIAMAFMVGLSPAEGAKQMFEGIRQAFDDLWPPARA